MSGDWNADRKHSDVGRWICIYPAYINSKKTLAQGRRVNKEKAVENPVHQEIRDVVAAAGFKVGVENKVYPREKNKELPQYRGRIRVQLRNDDGAPVVEKIPTRDSLLLHLCEMIPKLKSRQARPGGGGPSSEQQQSGGAASAAGGAGGKKNKGKGGRR